MRVAVFLVALPLITCLVVARSRYRIAATRVIDPPRLPVGHPATVHVHLENAGRVPTGLILLEDRLPYALGTRPRFILDRMSARWSKDIVYQVRAELRGRYTLGPLTLRVSDPFGLVDLTRAFKATDTMIVTPTVVELPDGRLTGEWASSGTSRPRSTATEGQEDVTVREYRDGDDLRRVHWRSSARRGELMVRREEQPWQSRATLVLDTRQVAHHGTGPGASLEWAVSAAASISTHLTRREYALKFATDTGATVNTATRESAMAGAADGLLLDALASVQPSRGYLRDVATTFANDISLGVVIAITGTLAPADAEALAELRHRASAAYAITLDTTTWAQSDRSRVRLTEQFDQAKLVLRRNGWQVVEVSAGDTIAATWARLVHGTGDVTGTGRTGAPRQPAAATNLAGGA